MLLSQRSLHVAVIFILILPALLGRFVRGEQLFFLCKFHGRSRRLQGGIVLQIGPSDDLGLLLGELAHRDRHSHTTARGCQASLQPLLLLLVSRLLLPLLLLRRQVVNAIRARQIWAHAGFVTTRPEIPQAGRALDAPLLPGKVALVIRTLFFGLHRYDGWSIVIIARLCILNEGIAEIGRCSEIYIESKKEKRYWMRHFEKS